MEMTLSVTNTALLRLFSRSAVSVSFSSVLLGLGGCGYYASRTAHEAQVTMIGMTEEDVQACAGIPTRTQTINSRVKILEYQRGRNIGTPATSTLIPVQSVVNAVRDLGGGDGNVCIADFRIVDGKVSDVYYSGDNDMLVGTDGVCSSVVRGCVRRAVPSGSPSDFWKTSAFMQPQPGAQPPASVPAGAEPAALAPPLATPEGGSATSLTPPAATPVSTSDSAPVSTIPASPSIPASAAVASPQSASPAAPAPAPAPATSASAPASLPSSPLSSPPAKAAMPDAMPSSAAASAEPSPVDPAPELSTPVETAPTHPAVPDMVTPPAVTKPVTPPPVTSPAGSPTSPVAGTSQT